MKILSLEQNGVVLPDTLKWITPGSHPFKDLLNKEIQAIELELSNLELLKKTIVKRRKQEQNNYNAIKALSKATCLSSDVDMKQQRDLLLKLFRKTNPQKYKGSMRNGKASVEKKDKDIDEEEEEDKEDQNEDVNDEENEQGDDQEGKDEEEISTKEEHKKRKYVILVKKCECCGLEVKRHNCKHLLCEKPCSKEERNLAKKQQKN